MPLDVHRPMTPRPHIHHYAPSFLGDSTATVLKVSKMKPDRYGLRALDLNFQWAWRVPGEAKKGGNAYNLHWAKPWQNNYHFILDPGAKRARLMTKAERRRPIHQWPASHITRWRRTRRARSTRPYTYAEMATFAAKHSVTVCGELKSSQFRYQSVANQMVRHAVECGHPPWFMALYGSLAYAPEKCEAITRAEHEGIHGQFAVIFGRSSLQRKWRPRFNTTVRDRDAWPVPPTRTW